MTAQINTKMILHSIAPHGKELISIQSYTPYFLDAEIEKHGQICSNSSSNRAIPLKKMVKAEFFIPPDIRKEQSGMQGLVELTQAEFTAAHRWISNIRQLVVDELLIIEEDIAIHKQTLNRYISPWSMQRKIMTGTREAWDNVLKLRDHKDADPSIQIWARSLRKTIENSTPKPLKFGEWHLPYITDEDRRIYNTLELLLISTARCARTSYRLFDGKLTTYSKDFDLFMLLIGSDPVHATPLEHQGLCLEHTTCMNGFQRDPNNWPRGVTHMMANGELGSGRLTGWVQNRHWWNYEYTTK